MQSSSHDNTQAMQRIRVGMTGLAAVVLLIGVGSAIYTSASNEEPVTAIGAPRPNVVADLTAAPVAPPTTIPVTDEPLAELGVSPTATNIAAPAEATPAPAR